MKKLRSILSSCSILKGHYVVEAPQDTGGTTSENGKDKGWSEEEMFSNRPFSNPIVPPGYTEAVPYHGILKHGSIVIAAITSCTNTSNPVVMLGAGLLAKKAVEKGLTVNHDRQDKPRSRIARRHRLSGKNGPAEISRSARISTRRLRMHHLHRQ